MSRSRSSLFHETSERLLWILDRHIHDYSRGQIAFLRQKVLEDLSTIGITEPTYKPREHFWIARMWAYEKVIEYYGIEIEHGG